MRIFSPILLFLSLSIFSYGQQRGFTPVLVKMGASAGTLYEQSHALVIGISDYSNGWPDLPGVKNDIEAVKTTFELHGFNVVTKENLSKEQMDEVFSEFISQYGQVENARLVIYFAGHGHTIKTSYGDKLGYIVPANAPNPNQNPAAFQKAALEMAQIEIYAKRIQSKHVLFLFDACFSGNLFAISRSVPEAISYKTSMPVRQFITSGDENETVPDKSIFKQQLVMALTSKFADANNDGYLTGTELGEY
ncbi:MAG TPA: caspase family protein, partial [Bacteroidia bacterium]|nr:caspase family protein [Bacteroidia bacterium]